jgi:hypothetical protein
MSQGFTNYREPPFYAYLTWGDGRRTIVHAFRHSSTDAPDWWEHYSVTEVGGLGKTTYHVHRSSLTPVNVLEALAAAAAGSPL